MREGLVVLEKDLRVQFANKSFYEMSEADAEETVGEQIYDLGNKQWDISKLRTLLEEILPQHEVFNDYRVEHEFEHIGHRVMLLNARRLDHMDLILLAIEDITEREMYEQALLESEEFHRLAAEAGKVGTWILDLESDDIHISPPMARLMSYDVEQKGGMHLRSRQIVPRSQWMVSIHPEDRPAVEAAFDELTREEQSFALEFRIQRSDGSIRWLYSQGDVTSSDSNGAVRLRGASIDITERKEAEKALHDLTETLEDKVQARTETLQELAVRLTRAEQAERHRISQVLHDDLQQWLYSVQLSLDMMRDAIRDEIYDEDAFLQKLAKASDRVHEAIQRTRRLSVDLSPPILEGEGLTETFGWLASQMQEQHELTVEVNAEGSFQIPDQDLRLLLFQSVRELLFNVVKHADVRHATVHLRWVDDELCIQVADEGVGFDVEEAMSDTPSGWGLATMRERLELVGGRMDISSKPSEGSWITLYAPVTRSDTIEDHETGA